jgi:hypothetical protein
MQGSVDNCLLARVRKAAKGAKHTKYFGLHRFRKTFGTRFGEKFGVRNAMKPSVTRTLRRLSVISQELPRPCKRSKSYSPT